MSLAGRAHSRSLEMEGEVGRDLGPGPQLGADWPVSTALSLPGQAVPGSVPVLTQPPQPRC